MSETKSSPLQRAKAKFVGFQEQEIFNANVLPACIHVFIVERLGMKIAQKPKKKDPKRPRVYHLLLLLAAPSFWASLVLQRALQEKWLKMLVKKISCVSVSVSMSSVHP